MGQPKVDHRSQRPSSASVTLHGKNDYRNMELDSIARQEQASAKLEPTERVEEPSRPLSPPREHMRSRSQGATQLGAWTPMPPQPPKARIMARGRSAVRRGTTEAAVLQELSMQQVEELAARASAHVAAARAAGKSSTPTDRPAPQPCRNAGPQDLMLQLLDSVVLRFESGSRQPVVALSGWDEQAARAWLLSLRLELTLSEEGAMVLDNPLCNGMLLHDLARTVLAERAPHRLPPPHKPPHTLAEARAILTESIELLIFAGTLPAHGCSPNDKPVRHQKHGCAWSVSPPHHSAPRAPVDARTHDQGAVNPTLRPVGTLDLGPGHAERLHAVVEAVLRGRTSIAWGVIAHMRMQFSATAAESLEAQEICSAAGSGPVLQHTWRAVRPGFSAMDMQHLEASLAAWICQNGGCSTGVAPVAFSTLLDRLATGVLLAQVTTQLLHVPLSGIQRRPANAQACRSNLQKCVVCLTMPLLSRTSTRLHCCVIVH